MNPSEIEKVIREYLPNVVHLSMATSHNNRPWVCEVHFAYDDNLNLYFRSLLSRRHSQDIAQNPHVAGNIVKQHALGEPARGVYFEGTAKRLEAGPEQEEALSAIKQRLKAGDAILGEARRKDGHQFYEIAVENYYVFGSFNFQPAQKYELKWDGGER